VKIKRAATTAAITIAPFLAFMPIAHAGPEACSALQGGPDPGALLKCLQANPPHNTFSQPKAEPQGMTPNQLWDCCVNGTCVDGGIDPGNYKTIVCDPAESVPEGSEGPPPYDPGSS
jgi:hypothetical protein